MGRQKWDPGEKNVKIHIVLEVTSKMYENIQKYLKMCKIENHKLLCIFDDFEFLGACFPAENRSNHHFYRLRNSPGILQRIQRIQRIPRKWCQEVLLRPHLHTRRGPG